MNFWNYIKVAFNIKTLMRNFKNWNFPPIHHPFNIMGVIRNAFYKFFVFHIVKNF
jgi:hypothetical protein